MKLSRSLLLAGSLLGASCSPSPEWKKESPAAPYRAFSDRVERVLKPSSQKIEEHGCASDPAVQEAVNSVINSPEEAEPQKEENKDLPKKKIVLA